MTAPSHDLLADGDQPTALALRPREAAKALGISARLLWQLTADGDIPAVRVGRGKRKTVLYPVETLRDWLTSRLATSERAGGDA